MIENRILIVDDQPANVALLERLLAQGGYTQIASTTDPRNVTRMYREFEPDLILLDLNMPHLDGFAVMHELAPLLPPGQYMPILVLTADATPDAKRRALSAGAKDFLTKPLDHIEVLLRIRNLLETRLLHVQLANQNHILDERVRLRTRELEEARIEILERLAVAAEYRDDDTGKHTARVGHVSARIAEVMDRPLSEVELIRRAAPLHDVGKIGIPDAILLKPGKLTPEEWAIMKEHAPIGASILGDSTAPVLQMAEEIASSHHERWEGSGYPRGLAGTQIPLVSRIVGVADVLDALTHTRPYKAAWPLEDALAEIEAQAGRHFDPDVVNAFLPSATNLVREMETLDLLSAGAQA
ncbi:MAG: HD domain-containing phosphohydrolase [Actinomycetota bacterium]